jgi:hypothetical protein
MGIRSIGDRASERIPNSLLIIYPGEAHVLLPKHWDDVVAKLLATA